MYQSLGRSESGHHPRPPYALFPSSVPTAKPFLSHPPYLCPSIGTCLPHHPQWVGASHPSNICTSVTKSHFPMPR